MALGRFPEASCRCQPLLRACCRIPIGRERWGTACRQSTAEPLCRRRWHRRRKSECPSRSEAALAKSHGKMAGPRAQPPSSGSAVDVGIQDQTVEDREEQIRAASRKGGDRLETKIAEEGRKEAECRRRERERLEGWRRRELVGYSRRPRPQGGA